MLLGSATTVVSFGRSGHRSLCTAVSTGSKAATQKFSAPRESRGRCLFSRSVYELRYFNIADNEGEEED